MRRLVYAVLWGSAYIGLTVCAPVVVLLVGRTMRPGEA